MDASRLVALAREVAFADDIVRKSIHVSIVLSGKSIVAIGQNAHKTHTLAMEYGYRSNFVHSELDAFSKIRYRNGSFVLYNFRFGRSKDLLNSRPCKYCLPWCVSFFDEIWYSDQSGRMTKL